MMLRSLLLALAIALTSCSTGDSSRIAAGTAGAVVSSTGVLPPPTSATTLVAQPDYRVGPLDLLEVSVFELPDFTRTLRVNSSGQISLPLVGIIPAAGKTTQELEADISSGLTAKYLQSAQVSIFVKEFTSQRVTVEGAVREPGIFSITGRTTLLQALAMAKGMDTVANPRGVVIFRDIDRRRHAAVFDVAAIRSGEAEDPEVFGNDIITVESSQGRSTLRDVISSIPIFALFTPLAL
jgi:polysaccharide export outer membrane protein